MTKTEEFIQWLQDMNIFASKEICRYKLDDLIASAIAEHEAGVDKPKIVCICGSTRFADLHAIKRWELERTGKYICLMINYLPTNYAEQEFGEGKHDHFGEAIGLKELLDELHFRKIDLCDEVFVINYDGYIGESTRNEINYAEKLGKPVNYLEPIKRI